ncbi:U5 snRNP GTPase SNU114 SCDLUD_003964 [Saccharomycodes ludwigii]|uniref:U5 snRNP GTPase SNU114 n=1 Tax=Saccharomycodes ludwigii TaxID=36035 RepID=UPI001E82BB0D|nr:hypothetical protein SCDLUD_003964 [Saccharomycodes ludwigii]KAH3899681.1 hypothetical protein SCDLUD_003964 [Saccharomycodes ludwigii]
MTDEHEVYDEFGNIITHSDNKDGNTHQLIISEKIQAEESIALEHDLNNDFDDIEDENSNSNLPIVFEQKEEDIYDNDLLNPHLPSTATNSSSHIPKRIERTKKNGYYYKSIPRFTFNKPYFLELSQLPQRNKSICFLGPHKSGKTTLSSELMTARIRHHNLFTPYYMDNLQVEIERGMSIKLNGATYLATDSNDKSWCFTVLDTPGHVDFNDEMICGASICDVICIVLDVVEGVNSVVERTYHMLRGRYNDAGKNIIFILNKIDRLVLELKLPPLDCYKKLKSCVDDINIMATNYYSNLGNQDVPYYSPEVNNVLFGSGKLGIIFSIEQFVSQFYWTGLNRDPNRILQFTERMWGDVYFTGTKFTTHINAAKNIKREVPTFVQFILEPFYKIITHSISLNSKDLSKWLEKHFKIKYSQESEEFLPTLRSVFKHIFAKGELGFIDAIIDGKKDDVEPVDTSKLKHRLVAHAVKVLEYCGDIWTLVKVEKGCLKVGKSYMILDSETEIDLADGGEDDVSVFPRCNITDIRLLGGRFVYGTIDVAYERQIVLVKGIDGFINKSGTLLDTDATTQLFKFPSLQPLSEPVFKIILQPYNPKDYPKLIDGLNLINQLYPGSIIKVEESGEHVVLGTGELYLDTLLYDLRTNYTSNIQIKSTAIPITTFKEGCSSESFASIPIESSNFVIRISAKPLDEKLIYDLQDENKYKTIRNLSRKQLSKLLRTQYMWDSLSARNCWGFFSTNCFINNTLPDEVDQHLLNDELKDTIYKGFEWCCLGGPLVEEPIHGVQFDLIKIEIKNSDHSIENANELIPLVRKACYVALLTAKPILYEPIYDIDIITKPIYFQIIESLFDKRRGAKIYRKLEIPSTPLIELRGQIPIIDSIGFEVDLKASCNGDCSVQEHNFRKMWRKVPGNVMDCECELPNLKPVPYESLSRDFVLKTRRRKGLENNVSSADEEGPSLRKYLNRELYDKIVNNGLL